MKTRGRKKSPIFQLSSIESKIIANVIESKLSVLKYYTLLWALYGGRMGACYIFCSDNCIKKIETNINTGKKRNQGNRDPYVPWSRAQVLCMTQLMVRMGKSISKKK